MSQQPRTLTVEKFDQHVLIDRAEMVFSHFDCKVTRIEYDTLHRRLNILLDTPNGLDFTMSLPNNLEDYSLLSVINEQAEMAVQYSETDEAKQKR